MKIAIFGNGRIGSMAAKMLETAGYYAKIFDVGEYGNSVFREYDVFLAACPFDVTLEIAQEVSLLPGKLYFDLTEDVEVGRAVRKGSKSIMIPHCGVAPGAISIIAAAMLNEARELHFGGEEVMMRVGAIPVVPEGRLGYALNWSTSGLVNEYIKPCWAVVNRKKKLVEPMEDVTNDTIFGKMYEAFNTSGGVGTLLDTHIGMKEARYQTIRWNGHAHLMSFLLDDLNFKHRPLELCELLERNLPKNVTDKVLIEVYVRSQKRVRRYHNIIFPDYGMSAIQLATAAGVVSVMEWAIPRFKSESLDPRDGCWVANEDIPLGEISGTHWWRMTYGNGSWINYPEGVV